MSANRRINLRIGEEMDEWLNQEKEKTGLAKSAIAYIALDSYRNAKLALEMKGQFAEITKFMEGGSKDE